MLFCTSSLKYSLLDVPKVVIIVRKRFFLGATELKTASLLRRFWA